MLVLLAGFNEIAVAAGADTADTGFPLVAYDEVESDRIGAILMHRMAQEPLNLVVTLIFFAAVVHTFLTGKFRRLAHRYEEQRKEQIKREGRTTACKLHEGAGDEVSLKATLFHFLGEVEVVFGLWVIPLMIALTLSKGWDTMVHYITAKVNYAEPVFVFVIMAIAASRPILQFAESALKNVALLGGGKPEAWWFAILVLAPILGSFITEPAAMTIAALLLAKKFYRLRPSPRFCYGTLGLLFVNISVGGTLTHFAAPPVLIVARLWDWDTAFMMTHFGWKAVVGILVSTGGYFLIFRNAFKGLQQDKEQETKLPSHGHDRNRPVPIWVTVTHIGFLVWTVFNAHYPALFLGSFLMFLGFVRATGHHQTAIELKLPILVGFFLAGLVIHGGLQGWWIKPVLSYLDQWQLMISAMVLTAFSDNAAITYLAAQVPDLGASLRYAVVAGAVSGGGLTLIANAPNPAGQAILSRYFDSGISLLYLLLGALFPTLILAACFALF